MPNIKNKITKIKLQITQAVKLEVKRTFGQTISRGEIRVENPTLWNQFKDAILPHCNWYSQERAMKNSLFDEMEVLGVSVYRGSSHYAFHNESGDRIALFVLTNGKTDTL